MSLVVSFDEIFTTKSGLLSNHHTWKRVELAAVAKILNGFAFKSASFSKENGFPLIRIRDTARNKTETYFDGPYPQEYIIRSGDLLIGMDGNFCCHEWKGKDGLLNQRVCKIIPDERFLNKKFLLFAINGYLSAIQKATSSVTVGHLSSQDVLRIPFPLPPRNEQRRIVAKLEKLLGKVDACKDRLEKIPAILKRFRQSVLAAAFSGYLTSDIRVPTLDSIEAEKTEPETQDSDRIPPLWILTRLGKLICDGPKNGLYKPQSFYGSGVQIVRIDNFYEGRITSIERLKRLRLAEKELDDYALKNEDLLINRVNSMQFLGKSCLVRGLESACVFESNMMRIRLKKEIVLPEYLIAYLNSSAGLNELRKNAKHAVNQSSINQQDVQNAIVVLPPIAEQEIIVNRLQSLFQLIEEIQSRYQKAKAHVDKLTQSILAKAFRGELVPQDPNDEPATELLKRIQAERKNQEAETRPGRKSTRRRVKN